MNRNIGNTSYWKTLSPYYQIVGGVKNTMPKSGPQIIFGGRFLHQPAKTSGLLKEGDIPAMIQSFIAQKKMLSDSNAIYNVMFHGNLSACWWNCPNCPSTPGCASTVAWRSVFDFDGKPLKYTVIGDPTTSIPVNTGAIPFPIGNSIYPNNDPASACMASRYINEIIGAITNPTGKSLFFKKKNFERQVRTSYTIIN